MAPEKPSSKSSATATTAAGALAATALLTLGGCNIDDFMATTGKGLSTEETVVAGLRAALEVGIDTSAFSASKVDGIPAGLPVSLEEIQAELDRLPIYFKGVAARGLEASAATACFG